MSILSWMFGNEEREAASLHYLAERIEELHAAQRRAHELASAYLDLRRALTSKACRNGIDNPTLEPLATILREHDAAMAAHGYKPPR